MEDEGEDLRRETEDPRRKTRDAKRHHSSLVFRLKSCLGLSSYVSCLKSYPPSLLSPVFPSPDPVATRITRAAPKRISRVTPLARDHLSHGLAAFRTLRRALRRLLRIAMFKPRSAHALGETAFFGEFTG